jgi:virginiamycin B lyase
MKRWVLAFSVLTAVFMWGCGGGGGKGRRDGGGEGEAGAPMDGRNDGGVLVVQPSTEAGVDVGHATIDVASPDLPDGNGADGWAEPDVPIAVDSGQEAGGSLGSEAGVLGSGGAGGASGSGGTGGGSAGGAPGSGGQGALGGSAETGGIPSNGGIPGAGGFSTGSGGRGYGGSSGHANGGAIPMGSADAAVDSEAVDLGSTLVDGADVVDCASDPPFGSDGSPLDVGSDSADVAPPAADAPDACSSRRVDDGAGIFVGPSGIDGTSCGTRQAPCLSIQVAIANANTAARAFVYLAPGLYVESISLLASVSLEGGWLVQADAWTPDCTAQSNATTAIQAPANKNITVLADALNGTSAIRRITVLSKAQAGVLPSESLYGIFARGATTNLFVENTVVLMASAGAGAAGAQGAVGAPASIAGCTPAGDASSGITGATGVGSDYGFTSAGYIQSNGYPGGSGGVGDNGTAGGGGGQCGYCWAPAQDCSTLCPPTGTTQCNYNSGLPGCGGNVGGGGAPGLGGGSSIALFVWDAHVTVTNSTLTSGNGGNGGDGGPGGLGGSGAVGAVGAPEWCANCYVVSPPMPPSMIRVCGTASPATQLAGGSAGGHGGPGGLGGQGGPGGGGWSCGYYRGGSGIVDLSGDSLGHGDPGQGGTPNGTAGFAMDACGEPGSPVGTRICPALESQSFPLSFYPWGITAGPDGNLWVLSSYYSSPHVIAKVTPSGVVTTFALSSSPFGIASGPDGYLWLTEPYGGSGTGVIGRVTPTGELTELSGVGSDVRGIVAGPDGNLWFTRAMYTPPFGRITTAGTVTTFSGPQSFVYHIARGPGSTLWYADNGRSVVGQIDMDGVQKEYAIPSTRACPWGIVTGPDSNIWFVETGGTIPNPVNKIGRTTVDGVMAEFPLPASRGAQDIAAGSDGNLWFTEDGVGAPGIGRITPAGIITEFSVPGGSIEIASGPDGKLWFTQPNAVGNLCP